MRSQLDSPYEALFQAFIDRPIVIQIARKQTRNIPIPWEDAAQAAYAKLWQATCDGKFSDGDLEDYCHWAARVSYCAILDFLRHSSQRQHPSLDQCIPGTDIPLIDTLVDEFNAMDALERVDLMSDILDLIADLDRQHATTNYTTIWQSLLLGKKQKEIAQELDLKACDISRNVKKIRKYVAQRCHPKAENELGPDRHRSNQPW